MKKKLQIEVEKVDGMYLREHVGEGEGNGVKFSISSILPSRSIMIEVDDPDGKKHVYLLPIQQAVKAIVDWHVADGKKIIVKKK